MCSPNKYSKPTLNTALVNQSVWRCGNATPQGVGRFTKTNSHVKHSFFSQLLSVWNSPCTLFPSPSLSFTGSRGCVERSRRSDLSSEVWFHSDVWEQRDAGRGRQKKVESGNCSFWALWSVGQYQPRLGETWRWRMIDSFPYSPHQFSWG